MIAVIVGSALRLCVAAEADPDAPRVEKPLGRVVAQQWQIGMVITAEGGAYKGIVGTTAVPMSWPDQEVKVVKEDLSPGVKVSYQNVEGAVRQMVIRIPMLAAQREARALVTFEIHRVLQEPPADPESYAVPNAKRLDRKLAIHLSPSPYIESNRPEIKKVAEQAIAGKKGAWQQVEAIYDWVRSEIRFEDNRGKEVNGALETLATRVGDCDEMTSLFVAMCRSIGVPARTVRVPGHVYPEFHLVDSAGEGRWFPCQISGTRAFGAMPDPRPVLQKGDNITALDPHTKKKIKHRYLPETLTGFPTSGGGALRPQMICERAASGRIEPSGRIEEP